MYSQLGMSFTPEFILAGADGVRQVIENVLAELDLTMGLVGVENIAGITRELLSDA